MPPRHAALFTDAADIAITYRCRLPYLSPFFISSPLTLSHATLQLFGLMPLPLMPPYTMLR